MELNISEAHWNELRYQHREAEFFPEEDKTPAEDPYTWFPAEVRMDGKNLGRAEVRKKGYIGSNDIRRPSLKLRFPAGADGKPSDIPAELTLNNNRQDPSLIRQYLAYEVFRRAGVPAPRCSFVRVQVNGKPLGLYTCVQPINSTFLKEHFGTAEGNLYEGGRSDFRPNWVQNFSIKNNKKDADRSDLERTTRALEEAKGSILPILNAHFDGDEFFRFWAVESLVNEMDGYSANMNNFYLYHHPMTGKFVFIPWGADGTFYPGRAMNTVRGDPKSVIGIGILANRLYNSKEGAEKYRATLRTVLKTAWNEDALLREAGRLEALLAPSVESGDAMFRAGVQRVRDFIKNRRAEIVPELEGPAPVLRSRPLELAKRRKVGEVRGKFSTTLNGGDDSREAAAELSGKVWGEPLTFRNPTLNAFVSGSQSEERIVLSYGGSADGTQYMMYLAIDVDSCVAGKPIPINNTHIIGMFGTQERSIGMLRGSLLLTKAGKTPGSPIAGEFTADIFSKHSKQAR